MQPDTAPLLLPLRQERETLERETRPEQKRQDQRGCEQCGRGPESDRARLVGELDRVVPFGNDHSAEQIVSAENRHRIAVDTRHPAWIEEVVQHQEFWLVQESSP